jgi:hypothetical protein
MNRPRSGAPNQETGARRAARRNARLTVASSFAASWRATGEAIELPRRWPRPRQDDPARRRQRAQATTPAEQPLWQAIVILYATLSGIVGSIIGLDILLAYLVTGSPPY